MNRIQYLIRRLMLLVPTFFGITVVCFMLTRLLPGGPVEMAMAKMRGGGGGGEAGGGANATLVSEDMKKELERQFGFDQPIYKQYFNWAVRDRLGMKMKSYEYPNRTAWELIRSRLPVSVWFGIVSFLMSYTVCIPLGIAKALRHGSAFDFGSSIIASFPKRLKYSSSCNNGHSKVKILPFLSIISGLFVYIIRNLRRPFSVSFTLDFGDSAKANCAPFTFAFLRLSIVIWSS
jgi:hypothetical protein